MSEARKASFASASNICVAEGTWQFHRQAVALGSLSFASVFFADAKKMKVLAGTDLRDRLAEIDHPALVVAGENDRLCPAEASVRMSRMLAGSALQVIAGAGSTTSVAVTTNPTNVPDDVAVEAVVVEGEAPQPDEGQRDQRHEHRHRPEVPARIRPQQLRQGPLPPFALFTHVEGGMISGLRASQNPLASQPLALRSTTHSAVVGSSMPTVRA